MTFPRPAVIRALVERLTPPHVTPRAIARFRLRGRTGEEEFRTEWEAREWLRLGEKWSLFLPLDVEVRPAPNPGNDEKPHPN